MSDEEVDAYMKKIIDAVPEYQMAKADLERIDRRTEAIRKYTKFMRISYWLEKEK